MKRVGGSSRLRVRRGDVKHFRPAQSLRCCEVVSQVSQGLMPLETVAVPTLSAS